MRTVKERIGEFTFREFCDRITEDQKADLISGVIYMASPGTPAECDRIMTLCSTLIDLTERELGRLFAFKVAFRLDERNGPEPDIGFVHHRHSGRILREYIDGPPDLVIEDVTPDSARRDYILKRRMYQAARVPEYWIYDDDERRNTLLRLSAANVYRQVRPIQGRLHCRVIPGFCLPARW